MNALVILGCNGHKIYGFSMCEGTQNILLDLRLVDKSNTELFDYMDYHLKVFDKIITDLNKIGNFISYLSNNNFIDKPRLEVIWDYISMHKRCGIYIYVRPLS